MDLLLTLLGILLFIWGFGGVFNVADRSDSPALEEYNWKQKIVLIIVGGPFCWVLCPMFIIIELVTSIFKKCGLLDKILEKLETKRKETE